VAGWAARPSPLNCRLGALRELGPERGEIDPSFVTSHQMPLDDAPHAFDIFNDKEDECLKVVLKTH
jgi:hypothetical protein